MNAKRCTRIDFTSPGVVLAKQSCYSHHHAASRDVAENGRSRIEVGPRGYPRRRAFPATGRPKDDSQDSDDK